ncbi:MAG: MATE family efflux transporter, partial [Oscillospiraceae bacterium]|nr:MATE family efflux transporter [Oscillospiraceae bacterium]
AAPLHLLLIAFSTGTGVGINALLSRRLGEGDRDSVDRTANTGIFIYLCMAAVFLVLGLSLAKPFFLAQTHNPQIIAYGTAYVRVCLGCSVFLFGQICTERLLQSTGRTDLAMIPQVTGAVVNMILDPIMIYGLLGFPRLEVLGAAIATVTGQISATVVGLVINLRLNKEVHIQPRLIRPDHEISAEILRVGVPAIITTGIGSVMNFAINRILIGFTEAATAVFGAYYKIQNFIFMPIIGLNNSLIPILSYNLGAKKYDRLKSAMRISRTAGLALMIFGMVLFAVLPVQLISIFKPTAEMIAVARIALPILGLAFPLGGMCVLNAAACQALRRPIYSMINSISRQMLVLVPAAYLFSLSGQLERVWWAFPLAEIASFTLISIFLRKTLRETLPPEYLGRKQRT